MHRSTSASRVSEDFVVRLVTSSSSSSPQSSSFKAAAAAATTHDSSDQRLPTCDPLSHAAKRERCRIRSADNAIHFIPLVLALCAIILWFFSDLE